MLKSIKALSHSGKDFWLRVFGKSLFRSCLYLVDLLYYLSKCHENCTLELILASWATLTFVFMLF